MEDNYFEDNYFEDNYDAEVEETEGFNIDTAIQKIVRQLQPRGYVGKEEAKSILCDYIDNEYTYLF